MQVSAKNFKAGVAAPSYTLQAWASESVTSPVVLSALESATFLLERFLLHTTLETHQGQIDGFFIQPPFKSYLPEVTSVGDLLNIYPWVASRAALSLFGFAGVAIPGALERKR